VPDFCTLYISRLQFSFSKTKRLFYAVMKVDYLVVQYRY